MGFCLHGLGNDSLLSLRTKRPLGDEPERAVLTKVCCGQLTCHLNQTLSPSPVVNGVSCACLLGSTRAMLANRYLIFQKSIERRRCLQRKDS